jgi:hypothetical protein
MKALVAISLLFFIGTFSFAQKKWVKQKLTNKVTVLFPTVPEKTAGTTYAYRDSTHKITYTATYSRIAEHMKIGAKAFDQIITTNEFASEFLNTLRSTLPQYSLGDIVIKKEKNQVVYLTEGKEEMTEKSIFLKVIFVDGVYYSLSVLLPDTAQQQSKNIFFNSYSISK